MLNIFTQLKTKKDFSNNERIIVEYILKNPQKVLNMNTKQLTEECYVSVATIYRLCEKLGCSGYSDLKIRISNSIHDYNENNETFDFDYPVKEHQTHYEIISKLKEDYEKTIVSTMNLFSLDQLRFAVNAMKRAKIIDIYTSSANVYFAENFKFQLAEIGVQANVPLEEYQQRLTAATSNKDHFAIIITFGGRGMVAKGLPEVLKERKTPVLLISSPDYVDMNWEPDFRLYISPYENHYNKISSFSTRMSILYILDVLYTCYFEMDYAKNIKDKLEYYESIRKIYRG